MAAKVGSGVGGRRPGAGRKTGAVTVHERNRAQKLVLLYGDVLPLDVMINNMLFWHVQVESLTAKIEKMFPLDGSTLTDEERSDFLRVLKAIVGARHESQQCAVDAAPYMHARIQSITVKGDPDKPVLHKLTGGESLKLRAERYAAAINAD